MTVDENDYHWGGLASAPGPPASRRGQLACNAMSQDPVELTRGLMSQTAELRHGFLDVLGESTSAPVPTVAQRAMNSPFVATVYERLWRPTAFYAASGLTHRAEQRRAASALHLSTAARLLDVACGPGNFTSPLAAATSGRRPGGRIRYLRVDADARRRRQQRGPERAMSAGMPGRCRSMTKPSTLSVVSVRCT